MVALQGLPTPLRRVANRYQPGQEHIEVELEAFRAAPLGERYREGDDVRESIGG